MESLLTPYLTAVSEQVTKDDAVQDYLEILSQSCLLEKLNSDEWSFRAIGGSTIPWRAEDLLAEIVRTDSYAWFEAYNEENGIVVSFSLLDTTGNASFIYMVDEWPLIEDVGEFEKVGTVPMDISVSLMGTPETSTSLAFTAGVYFADGNFIVEEHSLGATTQHRMPVDKKGFKAWLEQLTHKPESTYFIKSPDGILAFQTMFDGKFVRVDLQMELCEPEMLKRVIYNLDPYSK